MLNPRFGQHHPASFNIVQHGSQTNAKCWMMLNHYVGSVCPGLKLLVLLLRVSSPSGHPQITFLKFTSPCHNSTKCTLSLYFLLTSLSVDHPGNKSAQNPYSRLRRRRNLAPVSDVCEAALRSLFLDPQRTQ